MWKHTKLGREEFLRRFCLDLFIVRIRFLFVFLAELMNFYWYSTAHKAGALQIGFNSLAHASFFGKKFLTVKAQREKLPKASHYHLNLTPKAFPRINCPENCENSPR